jgi:DNA-binding XRE family transcriptional regulator
MFRLFHFTTASDRQPVADFIACYDKKKTKNATKRYSDSNGALENYDSSAERKEMKKSPYLISYEEEFAKKLQRDPKFRELWEAGETRRRVVSALIGERIRQKISQQDLAKRAGVKQPSLARVESGNVMPSLNMLSRLAKAMNASLEIQFKPLA